MWRSPLPKGILGDPHLDHMIDSSVPSNRDLCRSESVRPKLNTRSSVVLPVWPQIHPRSCQLQCCSGSQTCVSNPEFPDLFCQIPISVVTVCCWRHGLYRRYDPGQTTTIRRDTKLECENNTRKEIDSYLFHARKLDMEMSSDSLETGGVNEWFNLKFPESF